MLEEIWRDTWAFKESYQCGYEEGLKEGREKGFEQDRREEDLNILFAFVQARFPALMPLAEDCRDLVTSNKVAQQLVLNVGLTQTEDEAKEHLLTALKQ